MASMTVDLAGFSNLIGTVATQVPLLTYEPALKLCAIALAADTKKNFEGSHTPDGVPWPPIKPRRRKKDRTAWLKRQKKGLAKLPDKPLVDTGLLMASVSAQGQPESIRQISATKLIFGSSREYAWTHQEGYGWIPKREWLGINKETEETMAKIVEEYVVKKITAAMGGTWP